MDAVIEFFQLHPIVIDHAVGGHIPIRVTDKLQSKMPGVQLFQLFGGGAPAVQGQIMIPPDLVQIGEVGNDRCLLAAEGQVDEILDPTDPEP